ncbi:hypothetical protein LCGC14_1587940 [marine sediment metagenome]|uniref:Uncharacterized protein n=1 Tax=marine sediment metagenome TaxID=412755 RepID=A0A0F9KVK6_9ZZZZ
MRNSTKILIWLAVWLASWGAGIAAALTASDAMGAVSGFVLWQLAAGTAAAVLWCLRPRLAPGSALRRAAALPALIAGGFVLALVALFGWGFIAVLLD